MKKLVLSFVILSSLVFANESVSISKKIINLVIKNKTTQLIKYLESEGFSKKRTDDTDRYQGILGESDFIFYFRNGKLLYLEGVILYSMNDYSPKNLFYKHRKMITSSFKNKLISKERQNSMSEKSGSDRDHCFTQIYGRQNLKFKINEYNVYISYSMGYAMKCYNYSNKYSDSQHEGNFMFTIRPFKK